MYGVGDLRITITLWKTILTMMKYYGMMETEMEKINESIERSQKKITLRVHDGTTTKVTWSKHNKY